MADPDRAATLKALTRCPVCGKDRLRYADHGRRSAIVEFVCGGGFATFENLPITSHRVCAGPTYTAALMLEAEAVATAEGRSP